MRGGFSLIPRIGSTRFAAITAWSARSITVTAEECAIRTSTWAAEYGIMVGAIMATSGAGICSTERGQGRRTGTAGGCMGAEAQRQGIADAHPAERQHASHLYAAVAAANR
jgi:hypothetical protein